MAGASRLVRAAQQALPQTARDMIGAFTEAIPIYRVLPSEQVRGEIQELCRSSLRTFFTTLREDRPPNEDELAGPRASAARRAEEGVPLDAVLSAYHLGGRIGWQSLCALARPEEQSELVGHAMGVLTYLSTVTGAVAAAYLEEQQAISGEVRDAQLSLAQGLLDGTDVEAPAARAGFSLQGSFVVVAFSVSTGTAAGAGSATSTAVGERVAARRRQRRLQEVMDRLAGERAPGLLTSDGGTAILRTGHHADVAEHRAGALAEALSAAAGAPVTASVAAAVEVAALPAAGRLARELLHLVDELGRPPGGYRLADLILEYQLTRPSAARAPLAAILDPLDRNPDFLTTLETWLACGLDRRQTASTLHVHPNTLDYRLRRVGELTGADPATGRGSQLLAAATAARRLEAAAD